MNQENKNYYVYELWNPIKNEPFYIGLAKISKHSPYGRRPRKHIQEAINFRNGKIPSKLNMQL